MTDATETQTAPATATPAGVVNGAADMANEKPKSKSKSTATATPANEFEIKTARWTQFVLGDNTREYDAKRIKNLAAKMAEYGQFVPILVEATDRGPLVIDGERRVMAAKHIDENDMLGGGKKFAVKYIIIPTGKGDDAKRAAQRYLMSVGTNFDREDVGIADKIQQAVRMKGMDMKGGEIADFFDVSKPTISKWLTVGENLPDNAMMQVRRGVLGLEAAYELATQIESGKIKPEAVGETVATLAEQAKAEQKQAKEAVASGKNTGVGKGGGKRASGKVGKEAVQAAAGKAVIKPMSGKAAANFFEAVGNWDDDSEYSPKPSDLFGEVADICYKMLRGKLKPATAWKKLAEKL